MEKCEHKYFYEDRTEIEGTYCYTSVVCNDCDAIGTVIVEIPDYFDNDIVWEEEEEEKGI